jgi:isocitrate dehydrogenase kinase/phosphatase
VVWYGVAPKHISPETFARFRPANRGVRVVFLAHHADLLDAAFWQGHKQEILAGYVHDVFPYEAQKRFAFHRHS